MAREWDVIVIGGGLAGRLAALAADDGGASVQVIGEHEDALRHASGLIDLLGYDPHSGDPLARPFEGLASLPDDHPYSIVGEREVRSAMEAFSGYFDGAVRGLDDEHNGLAVGPLGIPIPALGYPSGVEGGLLTAGDDVLLVDFDGLADVDAAMAASNLRSADFPLSVETATVDVSSVLPANASLERVARRLDAEMASEPVDRTVIPALIEALADVAAGYDSVGIPAMLGIDRAPAVREMIAAGVTPPPFEIPTGPPSVLGLRVDRALDEAIRESDAVTTQGPRVVDYRTDGDIITGVAVDRDGAIEWVRGDAFVLATGGLVGGGLSVENERVVESLFRVLVGGPDDPGAWTVEDPFAAQPFARIGVSVDDGLRPVESDDRPAFENLWAAGDVLGGFDPVAEGSGAGVPIVTGYVAGRKAAGEGRR